MSLLDIFRQKRLTIVINKIDEAIRSEVGEPEYSQEQVISEIRQHLCKNIFECREEDVPEDAVIPISGLNALLARVYKKHPNDEKIEKRVLESMAKCSSGPSAENPKESMASELESISNIKALETRLICCY